MILYWFYNNSQWFLMFAVKIFIGFETCLATASQIWLDLTETCQLDQIT